MRMGKFIETECRMEVARPGLDGGPSECDLMVEAFLLAVTKKTWNQTVSLLLSTVNMITAFTLHL